MSEEVSGIATHARRLTMIKKRDWITRWLDDESNIDTYGNLYNWHTVDDDRGVCPEGWHVPSFDDQNTPRGEWGILYDYLGGESVAGGKMKDDITWNGTDMYGSSVSAGLYIYSLQTEDVALTRKMVLMK